MSKHHARCSHLPLIVQCAQSATEPDLPLRDIGYEADLGTAVHECLMLHVTGKSWSMREIAEKNRVELRDLIPMWSWAQKSWNEVMEWFPNPVAEAAFEHADDTLTLTGHIDIHSVLSDEVRILDAKTGRSDSDFSAQVRGYAFLAMKKYPGTRRAYCAILKTRERALIPVRDGREPGYYYRDEIDEWYHRFLLDHMQEQAYWPGPHCTWCRRSSECPAIARELIQAHQVLLETMREGTSEELVEQLMREPALVGQIGIRIKELGQLLTSRWEVWNTALKTAVAAMGGSAPTGDGRVLVLEDVKRKALVPDVALPILVNHIDQGAVMRCVSLSKDSVAEELRATRARGQKQQFVNEVMDEIADAGGLAISSHTRLSVKKKEEGPK